MLSTDHELQRLEQALQVARTRLDWIRRSMLDPAPLQAAEDLYAKAMDDLAAIAITVALSDITPDRRLRSCAKDRA